MSLDKVDDEATRILMVEFYRNLMSGKTKRQSLQTAQQYLRKVDNGKFDGIGVQIKSLIQSKITGNILATCADGKILLFTKPNLDFYIKRKRP